MSIGDKIKFHRKELGLTQTELGDHLGVKKNAVSKWECGRVDDIPTSKIKAMAALFDVPTSYLLDEEGKKEEPAPDVEDGLDMDSGLSEKQKMAIDMITRFSESQLDAFISLAESFLSRNDD